MIAAAAAVFGAAYIAAMAASTVYSAFSGNIDIPTLASVTKAYGAVGAQSTESHALGEKKASPTCAAQSDGVGRPYADASRPITTPALLPSSHRLSSTSVILLGSPQPILAPRRSHRLWRRTLHPLDPSLWGGSGHHSDSAADSHPTLAMARKRLLSARPDGAGSKKGGDRPLSTPEQDAARRGFVDGLRMREYLTVAQRNRYQQSYEAGLRTAAAAAGQRRGDLFAAIRSAERAIKAFVAIGRGGKSAAALADAVAKQRAAAARGYEAGEAFGFWLHGRAEEVTLAGRKGWLNGVTVGRCVVRMHEKVGAILSGPLFVAYKTSTYLVTTVLSYL
jgi:hypothetical protein